MTVKNKMRKKINNPFFKSTLILMGGTAFSQIINTVLLPIITRIYSPSEYGVLTIYLSLLSIFGIGALEYNKAISIERNTRKAIHLVYLCIILIIINTFILGSVFLINIDYFKKIFNITSNSVIYFLIAGILFSGLYKVFSNWAIREMNFNVISRTKVTQSISGNLTTIFLGLFSIGYIGILLGAILKTTFGINILIKNFKQDIKTYKEKIDINLMKLCLIENKKFAYYSFPSELFKRFSDQAFILVLTMIFGTSITGQYGLAYTIISLPLVLVGNSISDVFFSKAAQYGKDKSREIKALSLNVMKRVFIIALFPFFIIYVCGPQMFKLVFGEEWYHAGQFAQALSFFAFTTVVFDPISKIYEIYNKHNEKFLFELLRLLLLFIVIFFSKKLNLDALETVYMYSISLACINISIYLRSLSILKS